MSKNWFRIGLVSIFLLSLAVRFWGLDRFNTLVFDEVYYAKFGNNYLTHVPFFDGHPPLGKLIIALGIWLGSHVKFLYENVNGLTGSLRSPWDYRWINAFLGSFIPLLNAGIAYQLSSRRSFALIAGLFTAVDGIFIVESRYALINIYIVIFGLLGHWLFLLALNHQKQQRKLFLIIAGIAFGCSIATKWNGLFFLAGVYCLWLFAWIWQIIGKKINHNSEEIHQQTESPLQKLTQIYAWQIILFLGVIPLIVYSLIWIPHLQLDTKYGFIEVHKQILSFHERLGGNNANVHPYCAAWYKWPLLIRPMAYYYKTAYSIHEPLPVLGPDLPANAGKIIYDVHAMGNPFLWWFSVAAMLFLIGMLIVSMVMFLQQKKQFTLPKNFTVDTWIALYLVVNYATNLVPWMRVSRCAFIYHYMTAVVFAFLAIAWFVDQCLRSYYYPLQAIGVSLSVIILVAFVFWLPIYLGLPLKIELYRLRMWFNSWI
ncbi:phospholipid carrier-dependent glycosyltransferase [Nostoc sp. FACHB-87]|uniref:dolichyl-phosphate-mannose--protein mannosyltransferase n=1 Tax=Nostocaceae TaxID=1162 RepID=UPI00168365B7|nr:MULTISPECIES: phospholipid carrier-dependent glycosyltransferase [Nostocaceae]MBD2454210.1 phospholipid carrier-dependent glycosyltransferase [Nostoc sp. FACHB-87]MBD2474200.1 phospholipid carrier-dependent glycosyltransferase [Anabaena sp. FACHB-83]